MGKRHKPEEIVAKLRQVDVLTSPVSFTNSTSSRSAASFSPVRR